MHRIRAPPRMLRRLFAVGFAVFVTMYIIIGVWQRDVRRGVSLGVDALSDRVGAVQGPPMCPATRTGAWLHRLLLVYRLRSRDVGVV
jgi:hypothetical protein